MKALILFFSLVFISFVATGGGVMRININAEDYKACMGACIEDGKIFRECNPICGAVTGGVEAQFMADNDSFFFTLIITKESYEACMELCIDEEGRALNHCNPFCGFISLTLKKNHK